MIESKSCFCGNATCPLGEAALARSAARTAFEVADRLFQEAAAVHPATVPEIPSDLA